MECQTEESENDEEDDRISDCTSVQVRLILKNIKLNTESGPMRYRNIDIMILIRYNCVFFLT